MVYMSVPRTIGKPALNELMTVSNSEPTKNSESTIYTHTYPLNELGEKKFH